jgi:hypothetical protein
MLRTIILSATLLVLSSTALSAQTPRWLANYQRGERLVAQGKCEDAALFFLRAIREKDSDNERERLSGTRTIAYYPRRELGICLIELGILDFAEEELRTSIRQSSSVRAQVALRGIRR